MSWGSFIAGIAASHIFWVAILAIGFAMGRRWRLIEVYPDSVFEEEEA